MRCVVGLQMLKTYKAAKGPSGQDRNSPKPPKQRFVCGYGVITNQGPREAGQKEKVWKINMRLHRKLLPVTLQSQAAQIEQWPNEVCPNGVAVRSDSIWRPLLRMRTANLSAIAVSYLKAFKVYRYSEETWRAVHIKLSWSDTSPIFETKYDLFGKL